jgi:hypothetical protein
MSFGNRVDKCKPIVSYSQALMFFTRHPKVRSSRWAENARPIYGSDGKFSTRMHQYRIVAGPHDPTTATPIYFDLVLHNTSVIRYMAPAEDGKHVVYLTYGGWASLQTRHYMQRHGWYYGQRKRTTDGTTVTVPLNYLVKSHQLIENTWLAKLTFTSDNELIVGESDHMPVYKRKSSAADKATRATLRRKMDVMHDMLWFSIENMMSDLQEAVNRQFTSRWKLQREFGPFTSALDSMTIENKSTLHEAKPEFLQDDVDFTSFTIEAMRALYMCSYRYLYGQRAYDENKYGSEAPTPTQDDCKKAVMGYLMGIIGIKNGTHYEPLPKFMLADDFPARTHFLKPR